MSNGLFHGQVDLQRYGALKTATNRTKEETTELNQLEKQLDDVFQEKEVALLAWWEEEGYGTFMANMKKPGQWAGDLELGQLGRFWGANVDGYKNDNPHHIHIEHGTISLDKEKESYLLENKNGKKNDIQQLSDRGVVDCVEDITVAIMPLTKEEVTQRLDAVPESEKVLQFLAEQKDQRVPFKNVYVPDTQELKWSAECVDQLVQRNVIARTPQNQFKFTDLTDEDQFSEAAYKEAETRIQKIEDKDRILSTREECHVDAPVLALINNEGIHWSEGEFVEMLPAPEAVDYTETELYRETIKHVEEKNKKPLLVDTLYLQLELDATQTDKEDKWALLVEKVDEEKEKQKVEAKKQANPSETFITYTTFSGGAKEVSRDTQILLDELLAEEIQQDEYEQYLNLRRK
ncbi:hypothetical protein [Aquicella lusitana]|uniref:hypothetical protein n=1 Tax=Aquicella lusitana TaxID=254246 RepID=UPI0011DDB5D4|nr:hypothetical protein [Aquicella lusitana]